MADQKLTELTALTTIVGTDILYVVSDPGGTPLSRKITRDNFLNSAGNAFGDFNYDFVYNRLRIKNPAATFYTTFVNAAIGANRNLNMPLLTADDTLAVLLLAQTFATGAKTFNSAILKIRNPGDTFSYTIKGAALAADHDLTLPLLTGNDTLAALAVAQTWSGAQTFADTMLLLRNPADTFSYTIKSGAITADRQLNLPVITGTDTLATLGLAQTFSAALTMSAKVTMYGVIDTLATLTYGATTDIDFDTTETVTLSLAGNVIFTTSNKAAGKRKTIFIDCDATPRTFSFPAWKFQGGAAPASIAANKTATLVLECISTTDASIRASYGEEP